jgi:hypothetical protein
MMSSRHLHAKRRLTDVLLETILHNHHVTVNAMIAVFLRKLVLQNRNHLFGLEPRALTLVPIYFFDQFLIEEGPLPDQQRSLTPPNMTGVSVCSWIVCQPFWCS